MSPQGRFILAFLMMRSAFSACLSNNTLTELGLKPIIQPVKPTSGVCGLSQPEFALCVEEAPLANAMRQKTRRTTHFETAKYRSLRDSLLPVVSKFERLLEKMEETGNFNGTYIDVKSKRAIGLATAFLPTNSSELQQRASMVIQKCINAQNRVSVDSLCLLASEDASTFTIGNFKNDEANFKRTKTADKTVKVIGSSKKARKTNSKKSNFSTVLYTVKTTRQSAEDVVNACLPLIHASCIFQNIKAAKEALVGSKTNESNQLSCPIEFADCCRQPHRCSSNTKSRIFEAFFLPFGSRVTEPKEITKADDWLTELIGSFWERTKDRLSDTYEMVSDFTIGNYERVQSLFKDWGIDLFDFSSVGYSVSEDGRSVLADGELSSAVVHSAPLFPAFIGLLFLLAQLFF